MEYTEQQWADMRRWVNQWKETGQLLEQIKADELAAMTDETAQQAVHDVLLMGDHWREKNPHFQRHESGLIEQQRLFMKAHAQLGKR